MKQTIAPPSDKAKAVFVDAIRAGLSTREAAARTATTYGSFKLERQRDLAFAVAIDAAFHSRPGSSRRSKAERLIEVAAVYLTRPERARLAERVKWWAA